MSPAPTPFHILRNHSAPLSALSFDPENRFLYAGDQDGDVSITDLRSRRPVSLWQAHEGGVLSVEEWNGRLISHGRDNSLHIHQRTPRHGALSSGPGPSRSAPPVEESLTTNSLNFCRFSVCPLARQSEDGRKEALLAVPNLVDSELVDIYLLPSRRRLHASINYTPKPKGPIDEMSIKPDAGRTGLVMGIHLAFDSPGRLNCVMGFEDGRIEVWQCGSTSGAPTQGTAPSSSELPEEWRRTWDARMSSGPRLWEKVYEAKGHNEAVMAMAVDGRLKRAFTVSADHLVVRYDLSTLTNPSAPLQLVRADQVPEGVKSFSTGSIGNASIAVSHDSAVVAVGGWDGKIRLFSASSLKPLGILAYHRDTVHTLAFASSPLSTGDAILDSASTVEIGGEDEEDSDDEAEDGRGEARDRWLASGGKDNRIALWALKDFTK